MKIKLSIEIYIDIIVLDNYKTIIILLILLFENIIFPNQICLVSFIFY